jgi:hypothetical protein
MEQIKAFDALAASVIEACQIPDAIPSKVNPIASSQKHLTL